MAQIVVATEGNFDSEVLHADVPVLVDFSAEWCAPCRMMEGTLEEIAAERAGKLKVVRVSVDESPAVATRYGVQGLPTLLLLQDGRPVTRLTGYISKQRLLKRLGDHVWELR